MSCISDCSRGTAQPFVASNGSTIEQLRRRRVANAARALALLAVALGLAACKDTRNTYAPPPPPKVDVAQPAHRPITAYFALTGNTAAINTVDLVARVQGFLASIDYTDGVGVNKGAQLFTIEKDTYQAQLDQAKANLESAKAGEVNAKANYQRQSTLAKQDFASQATLDSARASYEQAVGSTLASQASLEVANINLGYTTILAPFDGVVTTHLVDVGSLVGVSGPTKLATIVQLNPIYVNFNVSEAQVLQVKQNFAKQGRTLSNAEFQTIPVEIGLQGEEGYPHKGHIDYVAPQVDPSTGTLSVRGVFENKDRGLLPGFFARVRVPITAPKESLLIPDVAIGVNQEGSYVLVLGKDDVIEPKLVKPGQRVGRLRVIDSGIDAEDWVVTAGIQFATPGAKVEPVKVPIAVEAEGGDAPQPAKTP
jgi:membrane fusion protein, multidrug efflux system